MEMTMKTWVLPLMPLAFLMTPTLALGEECGSVTLAEMNWASAGTMAHIDKIILSEGYGCDVDLIVGDTVPTFTSMREKSEPDMAPEFWINAVREPLEQAVAEGNLIVGGKVLKEGGVQGFWVPTFLAQDHGLKTVDDVLARPELFPGAEDESKGAFFTCPTGWDCRAISANLLQAWDAVEKGFEIVETGSAAGLDGSIARALERKEGWFGYYWAPTAMLGKYEMTLLEFGVPFDEQEWATCTSVTDCPAPQKNGWETGEVFTVVTREFAEKASVAMGYVENRSWNNATASKVLAWMEQNQANNEDGAYYFLENFEEVWTQWVPIEIAEKVKAAI